MLKSVDVKVEWEWNRVSYLTCVWCILYHVFGGKLCYPTIIKVSRVQSDHLLGSGGEIITSTRVLRFSRWVNRMRLEAQLSWPNLCDHPGSHDVDISLQEQLPLCWWLLRKNCWLMHYVGTIWLSCLTWFAVSQGPTSITIVPPKSMASL